MSSLSFSLICHVDFSPVKRLIKPYPRPCRSLSYPPVHLGFTPHPSVFPPPPPPLQLFCQLTVSRMFTHPSRKKLLLLVENLLKVLHLISHCVHTPNQYVIMQGRKRPFGHTLLLSGVVHVHSFLQQNVTFFKMVFFEQVIL